MPTLSETAKELARLDSEATELRRLLAQSNRQLVRAKAKTADLIEAVYAAARDASVGAPRATKPPRKDVRTRGNEWALLHLSDWQVGKRTESFD